MKNISDKELRAFYDKVMENPHFMVYVTIQNQLTKVCNQFNNLTVDVTGEDNDTYKNYLSFVKTSTDLLDSLDKIISKLDPERAAQLKEEQTRAGEFSLESMIKKGE